MATHIALYAGGKIKKSIFESAALCYIKRMHMWRVETREITQWHNLKPQGREYWIGLDEKGTPLSSEEFAHMLQKILILSRIPVFCIGSAEGFSPETYTHFEKTFSFGRATWPHLMVRVMLLEQIYRAQQRILSHPYSFI